MRWDTDEHGHGVGDARRLAGGAGGLLAAIEEPGWVAEDPKGQMVPRLRRACEEPGSPLSLEAARAEADGSLVMRTAGVL